MTIISNCNKNICNKIFVNMKPSLSQFHNRILLYKIVGLLINFLHHFWPSLLRIEGFLKQFITPIVKCSKGKKEQTFFTIPQYMNWREDNTEGNESWIEVFYFIKDCYHSHTCVALLKNDVNKSFIYVYSFMLLLKIIVNLFVCKY